VNGKVLAHEPCVMIQSYPQLVSPCQFYSKKCPIACATNVCNYQTASLMESIENLKKKI